jgi:sulfite reductase (NADPH) hemoprotein beta-component
VARIAYLSSDVIVSVQAAQSIESEFSSHLKRYAGRNDRSLVAARESGVPEVGGQRLHDFISDESID